MPRVIPASAQTRDPPAPAPAPAHAETAPGPSPPVPVPLLDVPFEPKGANYKVSLALEDAELPELVRTIGQLTGRRFVLASTRAHTLKATVYSPEKVTVTEAYQAFLAVLQANGLTVLPSGAFWKIVDSQDATKQATPLDPLTGEERYVTRVLRLRHVAAEDIATSVLTKFATRDGSVIPYGPGNLVILTDTGENIRRMQRILEDVDVAAPGDKVWLEPLHYVSATDVSKKLSDVMGVKADGKGAPISTNVADHLTRMVALERPNALVIVGTEPAYRRVLAFLERLDVPVASEGAIHVVPLQYADAKKIVPAINEVLQGAAQSAAGKGGADPLAILDATVRVAAEETTNAILVTSTERDFAAVRDVISKLDKPRRQVYIEAVIMDLSIERDTGVGVQWHGVDQVGGDSALYGGMNPFASASAPVGQAAAAGTDRSLQALALGIRGPTIQAVGMSIPAFGAFIEANAHTLDSDILQTPHILATDNVPAEIHVQLNRSLQQNIPSYSSLSGGATGAATAAALNPYAMGAAPASQNYGKIGPQIKVTPHLNESDDVRLDVEELISDTDGQPLGTLGTIAFTERGAKTTLTVRDQQTVVIGGLVADKVSHEEVKVPLLGDIPLLGALFRHTSEAHEKGDLVLVLTPYIIRDQEDMRRIVERRMEERHDYMEHQALFSGRPWEPPKTFARARGLLGIMRKEDRRLDEERRAQDALVPRPVLGHEPTAPIELPSTVPVAPAPSAGTAPSPGPAPSTAVKLER